MINRRFDRNEKYISCFVKADHYIKLHSVVPPVTGTIFPISSYVMQIAHPAAAGDCEKYINAFVSGIPRGSNLLNGLFYGREELFRTELAFFQGDINTAERFARLAIFKAREKKQYETEHKGLCFLMRITLHRHNIEDLRETIRRMEILAAVPEYINSSAIFDIATGWLYTQLGETQKIAFWLRGQIEESEAYSMFHNFEALVKAKYLFCEGEYEKVVAFLNLEENKKGLGSFLLGMLEMGCLEMAAQIRLGDIKNAVKTLEKLWQAASPNSLDMIFIESGEV
jgi:LuxR family maltose regulon positive regulatory protein